MVSVRVRARVRQTIDDVSVFNSQEIYKTLVKMCPEFQKIKGLCISDMFLPGFLYKPLLFEQVYAQSDDEYKVLKKVKKVKYIDKDLLDRLQTGADLVKMLMRGEAVLMKEYICDAMKNRIEFQILKGSEVEFYIMLPQEGAKQLSLLRERKSEGAAFEIRCLEENKNKNSGTALCVLQSAMKVKLNVMIQPESESVFRVKYCEKDGCQYLKEGSVFFTEDHVLVENETELQAYAYYMEANRDGK